LADSFTHDAGVRRYGRADFEMPCAQEGEEKLSFFFFSSRKKEILLFSFGVGRA
jgi:hypothetical protein